MLRSELINELTAKFPKYTHPEVTKAMNVIIESLCSALLKGERIELRGFGTFCLHYHPPRKTHNPITRKQIITPAKYLPHFKPAKQLRERVKKV